MSILAHRCRALLTALAIDAAAGELPNMLHPVVWLGRWMKLGEHYAPGGDHARLVWGAGWTVAGVALAGGVAALLPSNSLAQGAAASTLLAYRALDRAAGEVQAALAASELAEARRLLGWHLVSRPTAALRADEIAAAAIESLAENLSDSIAAPLLAYLAGGLPGLAMYRFCNTADAMWGYRDPHYEYLGKAAARADDVLNLAPARITAALLVAAAQVVNGRGITAWRVAVRDHGRTASPNAGWPMAAIAGALDTRLSKHGYYSLGDGGRVPDAVMIGEARQIGRIAVGLISVVLALAAIVDLGDGTSHE